MLKPRIFFFISILAFSLFSCKNEIKDTENVEVESGVVDTVKKAPVKRAAKKDLTQEDRTLLKSLMSRIMKEPNLKMFASYIVSADLTNKLSNEEGPFTVFAPSNSVLESLTSEKKRFYSNPENKAELVEMLKSHIVEGKLDKGSLLQAIGKSGRTNLKTLAGITLTATKSGDDIFLTDGKNMNLKVVKGSIESSNGVVYIVDNVLNAN